MKTALFTFALIFIQIYPHISEASGRVVAAQVIYSNARNYDEFEKEVISMKNAGINTLIFRVYGNNGDRIYNFASSKHKAGAYFKTTHSPVIDDILGSIIDIAHKHGLEIFAWMKTRHAFYGLEDDLLDREFNLADGMVKKLPKLDLFNERAVDQLRGLFFDLASYPIDGVLIQDDFTIRHMEGLGNAAKAAYYSEFGIPLNPKSMYSELELKENGRVKRIVYTEKFWDWTGFKNRNLREVADILIAAIKQKNPNIKIALNVSYELFNKPQNALSWFAHDTELVRKFDYAAVMAYQSQIMKELGIDLHSTAKLIRANTLSAIRVMGSPKKVIMKIQAMDWQTRAPLPSNEVMNIYRTVESVSDEVGIAVVPWIRGQELDMSQSRHSDTR